MARKIEGVESVMALVGALQALGKPLAGHGGPVLVRATWGGATGGTGVAGRQPVAIGSGAPFCFCVRKGGPAGTPPPALIYALRM